MAHAELELSYGICVMCLIDLYELTWYPPTGENTGLDEIVYEQRALAVKHSVSFGDLLVHDISLLRGTHKR